jgi:hypothetical protein
MNSDTSSDMNSDSNIKEAKLRFPLPEAKTATVQPRPLGELLDAVVAILRRYVVFSLPEQASVIAAWIIHTWLFDAFDYTAYLFVFSAAKRSGKSRVLEVIEQLARKPIKTEGASAAALVRSVGENDPPTMLLDEMDALYSKKTDTEGENTRRFLNAGYRRGAKFLRCFGQGADINAKYFPAFCPKALAGINRCLPDTVLDRSILIELVRQSREQKAERFREREVKEIVAPLRAELEALAKQQELIDALRDARPVLPEALNDRLQDITEPLIAIVDRVGGDWPGRLREALVKLCAGEEDADRGVKLLAAIKAVFDKTDQDKLTTRQVLDGLITIEDGPWALMFEDALKHERLSSAASRLARMLKPYKIKTHTIRVSEDETGRGYCRGDFEKEWERYLPPPAHPPGKGNTPSTPNTHHGKNVLPLGNVLSLGQKGSTHCYEGKNENVLSVISVLPYAEGAEERVDSHNLLAGLISVLNAEVRDGLFPKARPDCQWGYQETDDGDGNHYPREYTTAQDYLRNGNRDEQEAFELLCDLLHKIETEAWRGNPLCSNYREWEEGSFPPEYHAAKAYVDAEKAKLEAKFEPVGKTVFLCDYLRFKDAADFRAFYGDKQSLPETCIGLKGSPAREELKAVLDSPSCCTKGKLSEQSNGFFYHRTRHVARCMDCQSAEWEAQGFDVLNGFPWGAWNATPEARLKEQAERAKLELEQDLHWLQTPEGRDWLAKQNARFQELQCQQAAGMTAGELLTEATTLFNATPGLGNSNGAGGVRHWPRPLPVKSSNPPVIKANKKKEHEQG